jgi:ADP-ribose pyrophosphatase YjhB (NUDIX family)
MRALARLWNAMPVRWQRRIMDRTQPRFLVGVAGLGVTSRGEVILARHRFGSPHWRFLGGFISRRESLEDALKREINEETGLHIEIGPLLEASTGFRWARVEVVYAYRVTSGEPVPTGEIAEVHAFAPDALPEMRADQRGVIERHLAAVVSWAAGRPPAPR